jgi:hypothetical protein
VKKPNTAIEMLLDEMINQYANRRLAVLLPFDEAAKLLAKMVEEQGYGPGLVDRLIKAKEKKIQEKPDPLKKFWGGRCVGDDKIAFGSRVKKVKEGDVVILPGLSDTPEHNLAMLLSSYREERFKQDGERVEARISNKKWDYLITAYRIKARLKILQVNGNECIVEHPSFFTKAKWGLSFDYKNYNNAMWIPMWFLTGECWK